MYIYFWLILFLLYILLDSTTKHYLLNHNKLVQNEQYAYTTLLHYNMIKLKVNLKCKTMYEMSAYACIVSYTWISN